MAYTAGDVLARVIMESSTGLPQDRYVNDFAFQATGAPTSTDITNIISVINDFYRADPGGLSISLGEFISGAVNRAATHTIALYHIVAGDLGSPFWEEPWLGPIAPPANTALPTEVAGVLSFHADLTGVMEESGSTRPKARRRGRLYLGPLTYECLIGTVPPYRLYSGVGGFLDTARRAAVDLMDAAETADVPWCVWSRADATLRPVVGGWTDDAPDTQRRRGAAANARVVWG